MIPSPCPPTLSPDNTKLIKVATPSLSAKWLFEGQNDTGNVVTVPDGAEDPVSKSANEGGNDLRLRLRLQGRDAPAEQQNRRAPPNTTPMETTLPLIHLRRCFIGTNLKRLLKHMKACA